MSKYRVIKREAKVKSCKLHADGTPYDDTLVVSYVVEVLEDTKYVRLGIFWSLEELDSFIDDLYHEATTPRVETVVKEFEL